MHHVSEDVEIDSDLESSEVVSADSLHFFRFIILKNARDLRTFEVK